MIRVGLDSNILLYLAGLIRVAEDEAKVRRTRILIASLNESVTLVAPVQALGELITVLRRNGKPIGEAQGFIRSMMETCETPGSDIDVAMIAADIVAGHHLQYWDALILTVAATAGCTILLSEDMHHGFMTHGLTVVNPLAAELHPKLGAALAAGRA